MLSTLQIRAARALLGWRQEDLAQKAQVATSTIRRIEGQEGAGMGYVSTLLRIQTALEQAGIQFIDEDEAGGIGVRLVKKGKKR